MVLVLLLLLEAHRHRGKMIYCDGGGRWPRQLGSILVDIMEWVCVCVCVRARYGWGCGAAVSCFWQ